VLARHGHIEAIPDDPADWDVTLRGAARLGDSLREGRALAELFRVLATLRTDTPAVLEDGVDALRWKGPGPAFAEICARLGAEDALARATAIAEGRP
jgi:hypothetical protein